MSPVSVTSPPSTHTLTAPPGILDRFHPAVRTWFERRFPDGPTEAQAGGWPEIVSGRHTLICAPTGSGETLAGFPAPITVAVRTGDSTSSERQTMLRRPPNLLVTTPESLYLYLTAERSRATLASVETVIVDEI